MLMRTRDPLNMSSCARNGASFFSRLVMVCREMDNAVEGDRKGTSVSTWACCRAPLCLPLVSKTWMSGNRL